MTPAPGDIFASHNARLDAWFAVQITAISTEGKQPQLSVLVLDWLGQELPSAAEVAAMKPKAFDFFFWNAHLVHSWVPTPVPPAYKRVGNRRPLVSEEVNSYSAWPDGDAFYSQQKWEAQPKEARDRFKSVAQTRDKTPVVTLGEVTLGRATQRLDGGRLAAATDLAIFDVLPMLTSVNTDRPIPGLFDFLRRHLFVYEAELRRHGETRVDLRGTHLTRLSIDMTGVSELYLNDGLDELSLLGTVSAGLHIHAEADGRWLTLTTTPGGIDGAASGSGLAALGALWVRQAGDLDMAVAIRRFTALKEVRIWGGPGYVRNLASLSTLAGLRTLTLNDAFGFSPDDFPAPASFPDLQMLWLTSIPADVAASVKTAYKAAAKGGLDLAVRQPRKPEWLAANLDNPFRNWDGVESITPAQAKKAAALYKAARGDALKVANEADPVAALSPIVQAYAEAFNKLDGRDHFIFTDEREQIYAALLQVFDAVDDKREETGADPVNRNALIEVLDGIRDW